MFSCTCGFSTHNEIYPVRCKCGRMYTSPTETASAVIMCPHLQDSNCEIATEIAGVPCKTTHETCIACIHGPRPKRLNNVTLTLAYSFNRDIDISLIQSVIDGASEGFGTRLANTLGLVAKPLPNCGCKGHQDILDVWNKEYILKNMDKIIDWLQKEAQTRRIPFSRALTRTLLNGLLLLPPHPPQSNV